MYVVSTEAGVAGPGSVTGGVWVEEENQIREGGAVGPSERDGSPESRPALETRARDDSWTRTHSLQPRTEPGESGQGQGSAGSCQMSRGGAARVVMFTSTDIRYREDPMEGSSQPRETTRGRGEGGPRARTGGSHRGGGRGRTHKDASLVTGSRGSTGRVRGSMSGSSIGGSPGSVLTPSRGALGGPRSQGQRRPGMRAVSASQRCRQARSLGAWFGRPAGTESAGEGGKDLSASQRGCEPRGLGRQRPTLIDKGKEQEQKEEEGDTGKRREDRT